MSLRRDTVLVCIGCGCYEMVYQTLHLRIATQESRLGMAIKVRV